MITKVAIWLLMMMMYNCNPANSGVRVRSNDILPGSECLTPKCFETAARLQMTFDENVDPCENFYEFACGRWISRRTIPEDRSSVSAFSDTEDDLYAKLHELLGRELTGEEPHYVTLLHNMYDTCMNVDHIESLGAQPLEAKIAELGGWPVIEGDNWDESKFDWIDTVVLLRKLGFSHTSMIYLNINVDTQNNTANIIDIDRADLYLVDRSYYLDGFTDVVTVAYFKMMNDTAIAFGADPETVEDEMMKVLNFETKLAEFSLPTEQRRNASLLYNKYNVKDLTQLAPEIEWMNFLNKLIGEEIADDDKVIVNEPSSLTNVSQLIDTTDKRTIANYLIWRMVSDSLPLLSKKFRNFYQELLSVVYGESEEKQRSVTCNEKLSGLFGGSLGVALGAHYVNNYFDESSKSAASQMVDYIRQAFLKIVEQSDWMDEQTRIKAIKKAEAIKSFIGYPDQLKNDTALSEMFASLTFDPDNYFLNVLKLQKHDSDLAFAKLRMTKPEEIWKTHANAAIVNAFYSMTDNIINFPAGILQNIFFDNNVPKYMNYAAIGLVIGHEITHGFDDRGRQFDAEGNQKDWWDSATDQHFKQKAQCFIDQYGNFTVPGIGLKVNGINTQGENIADNGGIKEAYMAYNSWVRDNGEELRLPGLNYSPRQLFWISMANVWCSNIKPELSEYFIVAGQHSPPRFRVNGPAMNSLEFSQEFNCPIGSPMNPEKKCQLW